MKNLELNQMECLVAGYTAWDCFWSVPGLLSHGASPWMLGYDIVLIKWCWNN